MPSRELVKPDYPSKLGEIRGMDIRLETVELFKSRKLRVFDRASSENSFIEGECWWPDLNGIANITELGDLTERRISGGNTAKTRLKYTMFIIPASRHCRSTTRLYQTRTGNAYLREVSFRHQHPQSPVYPILHLSIPAAPVPLPQNDRAGA